MSDIYGSIKAMEGELRELREYKRKVLRALKSLEQTDQKKADLELLDLAKKITAFYGLTTADERELFLGKMLNDKSLDYWLRVREQQAEAF